MAKGSVLDRYAQKYVHEALTISLTAGALNTPANDMLNTNWSTKDKMGVLINRTLYRFNKDITNMDALLDSVVCGLTVSASAQPSGGYSPKSSGVLDYIQLGPRYGTLVGFNDQKMEFGHDFSSLPGGGLLAHPGSLYMFWQNQCTANLAATVSYNFEMYYSLVELTDADWQELWQLGYITNQL